MKLIRTLMVLPALALAAVAFAPAAQAQPTNQAVTVGGLIDVVLQQVLNNNTINIPVNVRENQIGLVNLNNVLNDAEIQVLNNALNGPILSQNDITVQNILNNNEVLQNFLNNNNIVATDVVAINVLSGGRIQLFVLEQ